MIILAGFAANCTRITQKTKRQFARVSISFETINGTQFSLRRLSIQVSFDASSNRSQRQRISPPRLPMSSNRNPPAPRTKHISRELRDENRKTTNDSPCRLYGPSFATMPPNTAFDLKTPDMQSPLRCESERCQEDILSTEQELLEAYRKIARLERTNIRLRRVLAERDEAIASLSRGTSRPETAFVPDPAAR